MEGYLGLPELTAKAFRKGWLDTGDLGFEHEGELFLTGRRKDMLLLRGRNHAPEEVEQALDGVAGVRRGCVVAVSWLPEGAEGEELLVFVESRVALDEAARHALADACTKAIPAASGLVPDRIVILAPGTLPRTSSGKLRRAESLERWLAGELHPPKPLTLRRLAGALLRSRLAYARTGAPRRP
jgi:acyl-CoA synthetase (AMP-forming)/AMP-acid ligase II